MIFLVYHSEADATAAERAIMSNARRLVSAMSPRRLSPDGCILGVNLATGEIVDAKTVRWSIPQPLVDGRWAIAEPNAESVAPLAVDEIMVGVTAPFRITDADYLRLLPHGVP